jgi:16S rRNA (guanine527-N7)-methyltransferase
LNYSSINHLDPNFEQKAEYFTQLLLKWSKVHNLTGSKDLRAIQKNIFDSVYPLNFIDLDFKTAADIGSGAGFPAVPLAIARPDIDFTLIEPRIKRVSFLNHAKLTLGLKNVTIIPSRVEALKDQTFDLITSRAVSNTDVLLEISKNITTPASKFLLYKGDNVYNEVRNLEEYDIIEHDNIKYLYITKVRS